MIVCKHSRAPFHLAAYFLAPDVLRPASPALALSDAVAMSNEGARQPLDTLKLDYHSIRESDRPGSFDIRQDTASMLQVAVLLCCAGAKRPIPKPPHTGVFDVFDVFDVSRYYLLAITRHLELEGDDLAS
ncbi:hypothetical protein EYR40_009270 [Pleurotus pulmonarius]|nr:hypothetical protein EYR40_009270 [Pleurotus pulmonarius]